MVLKENRTQGCYKVLAYANSEFTVQVKCGENNNFERITITLKSRIFCIRSEQFVAANVVVNKKIGSLSSVAYA